MTSAEDDHGKETMAERGTESHVKLWLLIEAERWVFTLVLLGVVFAVLVVLSQFAPYPLIAATRASDPIETLFQALVTSIITGVTLVVTITQLVLSQELGGVGQQRERVSEAKEYNDDLEDTLGIDVSPANPAPLLQAIVDAIQSSARATDDAVATHHDSHLRTQIQEYTDGVVDNARIVSDQLEDAQFGTFDVVSAALDFNYSQKIHEARRLGNEFEDELPTGARESLEELLEQLRFYSAAREHIKTLYFRWELSNLSREILYAAVPALVVAMAAVLVLDSPVAIRGTTLGINNFVLVVCGAATLAVAPFMLLLTYILRIVTVTKRTLAPGPLILRETQQPNEED